jgi:hypothetical protein
MAVTEWVMGAVVGRRVESMTGWGLGRSVHSSSQFVFASRRNVLTSFPIILASPPFIPMSR